MAKKPELPADVGGRWIWTGSEQVSFTGSVIHIQRVSGSRQGTSSFPLSQVAGIQLDRPHFGQILGRWRVLVAGEAAPRGSQGALKDAADPFVVLFGKKYLRYFETMTKTVNEALAALQRGGTVAQPTPAAQVVPGLAEQLTQLTALHASGALTAEEFAAAKQQLLGTPVVGPQDDVPRNW